MADPILDEDLIVSILQCPINSEQVNRIQAGAMQAMVDLYDRKATRDEFISLSAPCVALYGQASKLSLLGNIKHVCEQGDLDLNNINKSTERLEDLIRKQCETVIEIVKRLKLCPTSQDRVH